MTLVVVAAVAAEDLELGRSLDALRDDAELEAVPELDRRARDGLIGLVVSDLPDEGPVELEAVDGESPLELVRYGSESCTSCLPWFLPCSMPMNACGADSRPWATSSRYFSFPCLSQAASWARPSGNRSA